MGAVVTTATTTVISTDKIYVYKGAAADGSRDAYITGTNLIAQVAAAAVAALNVSFKCGKVTRTGVGTVDITFDSAFSGTDYCITGSLQSTGTGFDGQQAIRFPMPDRTTAGCVCSIQSVTTLGEVIVNWIAVEITA